VHNKPINTAQLAGLDSQQVARLLWERYYHLISRCAVRAYIYGEGNHTKQSYEKIRQLVTYE
jgi:hypothetical protein